MLKKLYNEYREVQRQKQYGHMRAEQIRREREDRGVKQKSDSTYTRKALPQQERAAAVVDNGLKRTAKKLGLPKKPAGYRGSTYPSVPKYRSSLGVVR